MAQMAMSRSMDDLKGPAHTWGAEIRTYEREKRRVVDEGLVRGQQLRVAPGQFQAAERTFDPLLQRYRDNGTEGRERLAEEKARVGHLNRAADIQILREQPFHIINNSSKLEVLAPGGDPMRLGGSTVLGETKRTKEGKGTFPSTATDYNIVSNLPFEVHHWARPEERPNSLERAEPRARQVPSFTVKDYNIVTNNYLVGHDQKLRRDKRLSIMEATHKHNKVNKYDPISQQFNDPQAEERTRAANHARETEAVMRADALLPPSYKGRQSEHYGMISHKVHNPEMVQLWDTMEGERMDRYKNRYIVEHNFHAQDIKGDHIRESRKLNRIAPERYQETKRRGYDIIENKEWGKGPKEKHIHEPFPKDRLTPWEKTQVGRGPLAEPKPAPGAAAAPRGPAEVGIKTTKLAESSSAPQLRARVQSSGASGRSGLRRSESGGGGGRAELPPAPMVPGGQAGSVYSQPRAS
mmetsp:Transcript_137045/g.292699  ORF Transcript_137045/g.292699 Transcript_137045/m.292699 type:complete len:466 (+) Transcript_137045:90-1487(+)